LRAWWAFSVPVSTIHIVRQFLDSGSDSTRVKATKGIGNAFTSGGSPSAIQVPSAAGEEILFGSGTDAAPVPPAGAVYPSDPGGDRRIFGAVTNAAPWILWWVVVDQFSDGRPGFSYTVDPCRTVIKGDGTNDQDTAPNVEAQSLQTALTRFSVTGNTGEQAFAWLDDGGAGEGIATISADEWQSPNISWAPNPINGNESVARVIHYNHQTTPAPDGQKGISSVLFGSLQPVAPTDHQVANIKGVANALITFQDFRLPWTGGVPGDDGLPWTSVDLNLVEWPDGVFIEKATPPPPRVARVPLDRFDRELLIGFGSVGKRGDFGIVKF